MQHDHVLKKLNFDLLALSPGSGMGVCGQNICNHVAAFLILSNLICSMKLNFDLLTQSLGSVGKIFTSNLPHS